MELNKLIEQFNTQEWELQLSAADTIAELNLEDGNIFLINQLKSDNNWVRNAAALGMRDSGNQIFMKPILDRIFELGFDEEIGTLVYSLENFDCSKILHQIVQLHFNCNYEVQMSTLNMMEEQTFLLSSMDKEQIESILVLNNSSLNQLEVKFKLQD